MAIMSCGILCGSAADSGALWERRRRSVRGTRTSSKSHQHFWQCVRREAWALTTPFNESQLHTVLGPTGVLMDDFAFRLLDNYPRSLPPSPRGTPFPHILLPPACFSDRTIGREATSPDRNVQRRSYALFLISLVLSAYLTEQRMPQERMD
ncbi:hypothetical protein BJY52DRAFT_465713 [Lactarius psammicola]|nr:hypothetical protein BJY52DRAFT_465713 [Lactarius psammicola]